MNSLKIVFNIFSITATLVWVSRSSSCSQRNGCDFGVVISVLSVLCVYKLLTRHHDVFKNRGVEFETPKIFFGNMFDIFLGRESEATMIENLYEKFSREKLFGVFVLHRPVFVVKDVELVKQIAVEKFENFSSCGGSDISDDFCRKSLAYLNGCEWHDVRNSLNAKFAPTCISSLQQHFVYCANNSIETIENFSRSDDGFVVDTRTVCGMFVAESIATAVLGRRGDDDGFDVLKVSKRIENDLRGFMGSLKILLRCKQKMFSKPVYEFFDRLVDKANNNTQQTRSAESETFCDATSDHAFMFLNGSFKASTELFQMCFWELARNQKVQSELIREVDSALNSCHDKPISYEALNNLKFLESVINETLRKWPPIPTGTRHCNKDCLISTNDGELFKFKKGDLIQIPIKLIQNDPKYFPNPKVFDPARFVNSNCNLLAFGVGPRNCLGSNYVELQAKVLIFVIISKFTIEACRNCSGSCDENIYLNFRPRGR